MMVLVVCAAEAANPGNGRFKYIKRPVSKYPLHDEDPAAAAEEGEENVIPSADGAEGGDGSQPPQDGQPLSESQPLAAEGEMPPPEQQQSQEDPNQAPLQENASEVIIDAFDLSLIIYHK